MQITNAHSFLLTVWAEGEPQVTIALKQTVLFQPPLRVTYHMPQYLAYTNESISRGTSPYQRKEIINE